VSLQAQIEQDIKAAMKAREADRLNTLRMVLSGLKNERINLRRDLNPQEELAFLSTEAKRRRESIDAFQQGGRADLVAKEQAELAIIQTYLPQALSEDEVKAMIQAAITESGAATKKDFGKVMRLIAPQIKGRFDGAAVRPLIEGLLPD
jgi:uncharacterized protein YqeY